jgi:hypothetical protein
MALTERTTANTRDDVALALFNLTYSALGTNDTAAVSAAVSDGAAMVYAGLDYSVDEPSGDDVYDKYRHLWALASIACGASRVFGAADASTRLAQVETALARARQSLKGSG